MKEGKRGRQPTNTNPVCFEVPSTYEITVDGKKLIGSAQARKKEGVLQHGSLPLTGDLTRICQALVFERMRRARERGATLTRRAPRPSNPLSGRRSPGRRQPRHSSTRLKHNWEYVWKKGSYLRLNSETS